MSSFRVIVTGGRDYADYVRVRDAISTYTSRAERPVVIVHGDASGADALAQRAAEELGYETEKHPARWHDLGKAAGPLRNREMIDAGADLVLAFPGGRGTADCVHRAYVAGIPIVDVASQARFEGQANL